MLRGALAGLVVVLFTTLLPVRQANALYDPGVMSWQIVPFLVQLQDAVEAMLQKVVQEYMLVTIHGASIQNTLESEKILATVTEVARGTNVAEAQSQLQHDAARIKELSKMPPFAAQSLKAIPDAVSATASAGKSLDDVSVALDKRGLETTNAAAEASKLYAAIQSAKFDAPPSASQFFGPTVYSSSQDDSAQIFIKTVTEPVPPEKLQPGWDATPQGRAYELQREIYQSRVSMAQYSLAEAYAARRQVGAGTGQ
jgi:hypothetical protein